MYMFYDSANTSGLYGGIFLFVQASASAAMKVLLGFESRGPLSSGLRT